MTKSKEKMMDQLYKVYNDQCPNEKIRQSLYDPVKTQGHIILENSIEIIHFTDYKGQYFIKFVFTSDCEEYFFDNYLDAIKHFNMPTEEFNEYIFSITL
tara:strand:+ start:105 stop:401 length:297 start_codon:yes stop_codon:yes gene_type:complete